MWIKEPNVPLGESFDDNLNFVYQHGNIYVMDNHLAASWCWMNALNIENQYNLFHIDRHYDLLDHPNTVKTQIIDAGVQLNTLTLDQYTALKQPMIGNGEEPLFRWDNYIVNLSLVYPQLFNLRNFATHREDTANEDFIDQEFEIDYLVNNIDHEIKKEIQNQWILNLDIDYFFGTSEEGKYQMLSDDYIIELCKNIRKVAANIAVITICLSPDCCGGWDISIQKARLICQQFGFELPL